MAYGFIILLGYIWKNTVTCSLIFIIHIYLVLLKYSTAITFVIYSPGIIRFNCKLFNPFFMLYCIVIVYMLYIVYIAIIMVGD